jgi:hypothetical protein
MALEDTLLRLKQRRMELPTLKYIEFNYHFGGILKCADCSHTLLRFQKAKYHRIIGIMKSSSEVRGVVEFKIARFGEMICEIILQIYE